MDITIPYNFDPTERAWQLEVLEDPRPNKVLIPHRRAGKTSLAINKLILESQYPGNEERAFFYGCPNQRQAKEVVWKAPDMLNRYLPIEVVDKKNEVELTIYFKNKAQLHIKGGEDPDTWRGTNYFGGILDETDQQKNELYEEVLKPVLAANGGWIWFLGTPKGKQQLYKRYSYALEHPEHWQAMILKASQSGIIPAEALAQAKTEMTQGTYSQEFECEFLEGAGTIFRRIRENVFGRLQEPSAGRIYKMGVDLARHQDWTVVTVIDRHDHHLVYYDRFNQIDWQLQKARIEAIARRYNNATITIDSTGVGDPISEDLRRAGLIVQDFKFTNVSKKNLIESLAIMIEQNKISYPEIPELIKELEDFTYELLPSGMIRYTAPDGMHDDIVCSLALAVWQIGAKLPVAFETRSYGMRPFAPKGGYNKLVFRP